MAHTVIRRIVSDRVYEMDLEVTSGAKRVLADADAAMTPER